MRTTDTHIFFWGTEFSNWYASGFTYKGRYFNNSEQAFMWEKAEYFGDEEIAERILSTPSPKEAKALGRKVRGFDAEKWLVISYPIMIAVNGTKYLQNPRLKEMLLATGDKILVEASPYDKIWGIGLREDDDRCLDEHQWQGMNLLGKALMQIRQQLNQIKQVENERKK
jgi:ribA/ribD-fused uncharacterized protein